jgi:glyoxylase-like metal-dependent hydrolase (beta-lactamase superfamily II)
MMPAFGQRPVLYQWLILQDGSLPLEPTGRRTSREHVCTSTLVWPAGSKPSPSNSVVVDPCFGVSGFQDAVSRLSELDVAFDCVGYYLETHEHFDHVIRLPEGHPLWKETRLVSVSQPGWKPLTEVDLASLPGLQLVGCPGHAPDLQALRFDTIDGDTWVVGDAILSQSWLEAWMFFWPNMYEGVEIVATWRTVAAILETANVVIPGHGPAIRVDAQLLKKLVDKFPRAMLARRCPEVQDMLRHRLESLSN